MEKVKNSNTTKDILKSLHNQQLYGDKVTELIQKVVSTYYDLPITAYKSKSRKRQVIKMKQATVYFLKRMLPKATLVNIGRVMEYNHATILHSLKSVSNLYETDRETKKDIDALEKMLQFESDSKKGYGNIDEDYYYIGLDDCFSYKLTNNKAIVFSGLSTDEIQEIIAILRPGIIPTPLPKQHSKTGLFILEYEKQQTND